MKSVLKAIFSSALCLALGGLTLVAPAYAQGANAPLKVRSGEIVVQFPVQMSAAEIQNILNEVNCEIIRQLRYRKDIYVIGMKGRTVGKQELPSTALLDTVAVLKSKPGVQASPEYLVEKRDTVPSRAAKTRATEPPGPKFSPNDPRYSTNQTWHMDMIRMPEAWEFQSGDNTPIKVAVMDSGIDRTHPDFILPDGTSILVDSQSFNGGAVGADTDGHGTHVGGTVAAATNNGVGVTGVGGLRAGGVNIQLVDLRIGTDGGGMPISGAVDGFNYALQNNIRVINMSFGGPLAQFSGVPGLIPAVTNCVNSGIVMVGASGNATTDLATSPDFPTDVPGVIKVNAVGPDKVLASYSNYGGSNKLIIAAPGGDAADPGPASATLVDSTTPGNTYSGFQGTSMAAPHVAGAAGLLLAAGATALDVYPALASTAQPPGDAPNPDRYGPGIIDVYSALVLVSDPTPRITPISNIVDRGVSYFSPLSLRARISGAINMISGTAALTGKQVRQSDVNVDIYRLGDSVPFKTFQAGRDFLVPALRSGERKNTAFVVDIPSKADDPSLRPTDPGVDLPDFNLPLGNNYKIVYRIGTTIFGTQFIKLDVKRMSRGRSMFAMPFKAALATGSSAASKEQLLLGTASSFGLARFNPLRLPSEEDYARYRSNGSSADPAARFIIGSTSRGPLTYDIADSSTSIAPIGVGYWLDLADDAAVDTMSLTTGRADAFGLEATNAVAIRVFSSGGGWNMIGAPFTFPVEWSSVTVQVDGVNYSLAEAVNNGMISPALVGYDSERRDYTYAIAPDGVLKPFNAYWVRAFRDATIIVPPSQAIATRAAGRPIKNEGWTARLVASVAGDQDGQNYFGQVRGAADGEDRLDISKPPAGSGHAYVRFEQKVDQATRGLAFDLREPNSADRQTWRAAVSSDRPNADVTLSWEGLRYVPRRYKVTLRDETTGQTVPMQGRASYRYRSGEAGSTRYFQIVLEPQASGGALLFSNVRTEAASRSQRGTTVRFLLSQDAEVVGTVRALSGKVVATLTGDSRVQARKEATLRWSGRAQDGGTLPAGAYVLDITARTTDGSSVRLTRTVQHLR